MDAPAILTALRAIAVPEKAAQMAAYMKNRFTFLGVATPERRQIGKPYLRADKGRAVDWAFIDTCWTSPYREMHYIARTTCMPNKTNSRRRISPACKPSSAATPGGTAWTVSSARLATSCAAARKRGRP